MSSLSCVTITTLVVVSLANLVLLVTVILSARQKCEEEKSFDLSERYLSNFPESRTSVDIRNQQFMAALCVVKYDRLILICGTTIISKYWVITTAHCCSKVQSYNVDKLKLTSHSIKWKSGIRHDVDKIIIHEKFTPKTVTHNVCLIRVKSPFSFENPTLLASSRYIYIANTTALTTGWITQEDEFNQKNDALFTEDVMLVAFEMCKKLHKSYIDETMVCGVESGNKKSCSYDSGGPLIQKNVIIGLVSFETDCASGEYPRVFTRVGFFENWIRLVEKRAKLNTGVKFRL